MYFSPDSTFFAIILWFTSLKNPSQIYFPAVIFSFRYILKKASFSELKNVIACFVLSNFSSY